MAIAYRDSTVVHTDNTESITGTAPSGIVDDDILIITLDRSETTGTLTWPSGFTELFDTNYAGGAFSAAWKRASSESGNYTVSWSGSGNSRGHITVTAISGADDTATPSVGTTATGSGTTPNAPNVGSLDSGESYLGLYIVGQEGKGSTRFSSWDAGGYTEVEDLGSTGAGSGATHGSVGVAHRTFTGQTSENPGTVTSAVSDSWAANLIVILEAGGTTTQQALSVTSTMTPTIVRQTGKNISVASTMTPSITRKIGKILSVTSTMTAWFKRKKQNVVLDHYDEDHTQQTHTGDTNWSTIATIAGADLNPNTKYLIVANSQHGGNSTSSLFEMRVSTADDSNIATKSLQIMEPQGTAVERDKPYLFAHSFTTDTDPAAVVFEMRTQSSANTVRADHTTLWLLDLDALGAEGTDYFEDIQAVDAGTEFSTTANTTVLAQVLGSDLAINTNYLVFAYGRMDAGTGSTLEWGEISLDRASGGASAFACGFERAEGENVAEQRVSGFIARHQFPSGTPNITLYGQEETATADWTDGGAYIIAIPTTDVFADFQQDYTDAAFSLATGGADDSVASITFTPAEAGNYLVFGQLTRSAAQVGRTQAYIDDGTTEIHTGANTKEINQNWDTSRDGEHYVSFHRENLAASSTTRRLMADAVGSNHDVEKRWVAALALRLSTGTTFFETLSVTSTMTASMVRKVGKGISVSSVMTPTIQRAITKSLSVASTMTPSIIKKTAKSLSVSSTMTATLNLLKTFRRTLSVASTMTPTLAKVNTFRRTLSVASTMTPTIVRKIGKGISVGSTMTASVVKKTAKSLSVTSTMTATLEQGRQFFRTLSVAVTMTPTIVRKVGKNLSVASTMTPTISRVIAKSLSVGSVMSATITKKTAKTLSVASTMTASLATGLQYFRTLAVTSTMSATLGVAATYRRTLSVASTMTASLVKSVRKTLSVTSTMTPSIVRHIAKRLSVSSVMTPTLAAAATFRRALSVTGTWVASLATVFTPGGPGSDLIKRFNRALSSGGRLFRSNYPKE